MGLVKTYLGGGVEPIYSRERALNRPVTLPAGVTYSQGQVLGFIPGTGTAVNDVQTITPSGTVSGGTFRLLFGGKVTSALAYNATAAQVKAALVLLPNIGAAANLTVTGGGLNAAAFVITFIGDMAGKEQPSIVFISSLTGVSPSAAVTHTTLGKPAGGYHAAYDAAAADGRQIAKCALQYPSATDTLGRVTFGDGVATPDNGEAERAAPAWFKGEYRCSDLIGLDTAAVASLGRIIEGDPAALTAAGTIISIT